MTLNSRRTLSLIAAAVLVAGSVFALRMAQHLYANHEQVDVFHIVVGTLGVVLALLLLRRNVWRRS